MKIIKTQGDYYDIGLSYGVDKTVVWTRVSEFIKLNKKQFDMGSRQNIPNFHTKIYHTINGYYDWSYCHIFLIGFCGETYICVSIPQYTDHTYLWEVNADKYSYVYMHVEEYTKKIESKINSALGKIKSTDLRWVLEEVERVRDFALEFEKYIKNFYFNYHTPILYIGRPTLFYKHGAKVVESHEPHLITSPVLKHLQFYRVKDAVTAFQQISQFISGVLGDVKEIPEPDDKTKLQNAGFDETSFRREPGTPERKRRRKKR